MSTQRRIIYGVMVLLVAITVFSIGMSYKDKVANYIDPSEDNVLASGTYERFIWTDKESYELGEQVEAAIIFVNHNNYTIGINPIYSYEFSGNSVYDSKQIACSDHVSYPPDAKIIIPANGNLTLTSRKFTPTYPGPFKITGLGQTKTVNIIGYKEVDVNSTGISLKIEPEVPVLKDKQNIWFYLIIVNENPYPVKIPVFSPVITHFGSPNSEYRLVEYIDWANPHWDIPAYSTKQIHQTMVYAATIDTPVYIKINGVTLRYPPE